MNTTPDVSFWELLGKVTKDLENWRLADVFRFISFQPGELYGPHLHRRLEINYVKKGSCFLWLGEERTEFRKDEMMIVGSDVGHRFEAGPEGAQLMQLEFLPDIFSRFCDDGSASTLAPQAVFSDRTPLIKIVNNLPVMRTVERIVRELDRQDEYYRYLVVMYYAELLILIYRYMDQSCLPLCTEPHLRLAISYIRIHYTSELSIARVSENSGVSERYLRKLFGRYMHTTPLGFLNRTRVDKAVELLRSTDLSVKEVCFACGFKSPQYFARVFKQHTGMQPREAIL